MRCSPLSRPVLQLFAQSRSQRAAILLVSDGDRDLWPGATDSGSLWDFVSHSLRLRRTRSTRLVAGLDVAIWNGSKLFENPLWKCREKKYPPRLRSLSTCWRMRDSSASFFFLVFFLWQKSCFIAWCKTDLFIAVVRTKDYTHVKLLRHKFSGWNFLYARLTIRVICMLRNSCVRFV